MNTITKKILLSFMILPFSGIKCNTNTTHPITQECIEFIKSHPFYTTAGGVIATGMFIKFKQFYNKRRVILSLPLENITAKFNYHAAQACILLQGYNSLKSGCDFNFICDRSLMEHNYPATAYYKTIMSLIAKFKYYHHAFMLKKSSKHSADEAILFNNLIQKTSLLIFKLESVAEAIRFNKTYKTEQKAQIKKSIIPSFICGGVAGFTTCVACLYI